MQMSKRNFYLAVVFIILSTVLIIAISIKRSWSTNKSVNKLNLPKAVVTHSAKSDVKKVNAVNSSGNKNDEVEQKNKKEKQNNDKDDKVAATSAPAKVKKNESKNSDKNVKFRMVKPVEGTLLQKFSGDKLVYSKTLADFRTHNGIDIEVQQATPVKAALAGTVIDVVNDEGRWGVCVEIKHDGGLTTVYRGLSEDLNVKVDSKVNAGDVIGKVGNLNKFESALNQHLHFEVHQDGNFVDPLKYLKF